jgi:hypothetical protein
MADVKITPEKEEHYRYCVNDGAWLSPGAGFELLTEIDRLRSRLDFFEEAYTRFTDEMNGLLRKHYIDPLPAFRKSYDLYPSQDNEGFVPDRGSFKCGFYAAWNMLKSEKFRGK